MRTDRLLAIADAIEAHPEHFDMADFVSVNGLWPKDDAEAIREWSCGTTACVAGWACHLWLGETPSGEFNVHDVAQQILDLTEDESENLFFLIEKWDTADLAAAGLRAIAAGAPIPDPWVDDEEDA